MLRATDILNTWLAWAAKYERRLGAALFTFGFLTDFLTFGLLPVEVVNYIFLGYLVVAFSCALGAQVFSNEPSTAPYARRALSVVFPLGVQYAFGGLLSGFLVFYTAHSFILASWPFLLFVALIYIGNEYFRMYKHYFVFQMTLLFFCVYAYAVFALPLLVGALGPFIFLGSTFLAVVLFVAFVALLYHINRTRVKEGLRMLSLFCSCIVLVIVGAYFSGALPPVPLVLVSGGAYHEISRSHESYRALSEAPSPWYVIGPPVLHIKAGTDVYAFSAVAAPIRFGSVIVHRWERHDSAEGWVTESKIAFPIRGGREGGYRGYSIKSNPTEGAWRVSVETPTGQAIGRIRFDVVQVEKASTLEEQIL
jgi:hypothetical protein